MNTKTQLGLRVLLDSAAENQLQEMEAIILKQNEFVKINPSRLSSWIVTHFYQHHFNQQKEAIAKANFDLKKYLKTMASNIGNEAKAEDVLKEALLNLKKSNLKSRRRPTATKNQEKTSNGT